MPFPKDPTDNGPATGLTDGAILFGSEADDEDESTLAAGEQGGPAVEAAALKAQVDALTKTMEDMRQQNMMLMSQPAPVAPPMVRAAEPVVLPDPMEDAEGYATAVRKSIMDELRVNSENQQTQQTATNKEAARYGELWEEFQVKHKEYSGDLKQVRYAANIVAENAQKRGLDMEKYMFTYRDQFMTDVKEEMNKIFGDPNKTVVPTEEPSRTDSVFGGRVASSAAPASKDAPDDDPFKDIREFQIRTGFHR